MQKTVGIYTLGCKVSQYESEAIAEGFERQGFVLSSYDAVCDVYVINTCTVTAQSDRKSRQIIRRAIAKNPDAVVMVTGCYSQVSPEDAASIRGVSYVSGTNNKMLLPQIASEMLQSKTHPSRCVVAPDTLDGAEFEPMRITRAPRTRAYVKIEDGCECRCSYCIIPQARGGIRSKPVPDVIEEVKGLVQSGVREIVLTGIETGSYGRDIGSSLLSLMQELDGIDGLERIRLGSLDPYIINDDFIAGVARLKKAAPHFHISMQSGSDDVLKAMRRRYLSSAALEKLEKLRAAIPDVQFTTDMLLGFPGESEENFAETLEFARKARFLFMHIFPYSKRKNTPAASMPDQIPEPIKHERCTELAKIRGEIRAEINASYIGRSLTVLLETYDSGVSLGHTPNFLEVKVPTPCEMQGEIVKVTVNSADENYCYATLCD